jgi:hypothetical protein
MLHKCLKRLLRECVITRDKHGQLKNLGKAYTWYFAKLEAVGQMTGADKEEEEIFMNPGLIEQIQKAKEDRAESKRSKLIDENFVLQKERKFFEN